MSWTSKREGPLGACPNSVISAPAMKVLPSQINTIAFTFSSSMACFTPTCNPSLTLAESALTGGEFKVKIAILDSTSKLVTSFIAAMFTPFIVSKCIIYMC